jgi:hypothetical protein
MPAPLKIAVVALLLGACAGPGLRVQDPLQPRLESVRLTGHRICGAAATEGTPAGPAFACGDLPTRQPSGWRLTPAYASSTTDAKRLLANRTVVVNVSTPPKAELDLELVRGDGKLPLAVRLVPANPAEGAPGEIAISGQAGVTAIEERGKKLWLVEVVVSTCADTRQLRFFGRATKDAERSPPLDVSLVRDPAERLCIDQPGASPDARPGVGEPVNARAAAGCAGSGGTGQVFATCETCPTLHPPQMSVYSAGRYCSWEEVLAAYGYAGEGATRPQVCKLSQVGSREACEGK